MLGGWCYVLSLISFHTICCTEHTFLCTALGCCVVWSYLWHFGLFFGLFLFYSILFYFKNVYHIVLRIHMERLNSTPSNICLSVCFSCKTCFWDTAGNFLRSCVASALQWCMIFIFQHPSLVLLLYQICKTAFCSFLFWPSCFFAAFLATQYQVQWVTVIGLVSVAKALPLFKADLISCTLPLRG